MKLVHSGFILIKDEIDCLLKFAFREVSENKNDVNADWDRVENCVFL